MLGVYPKGHKQDPYFFSCKQTPSKFQELYVSKVVNPPVLELFIDGIIVRSEPQVKLFGIHIDQRLTFTYQQIVRLEP